MGIFFIPYLFFSSSKIRNVANLWINGIFVLLKLICSISYEIIGENNIPKKPVIVASKHQSTFETFLLFKIINKSIFIHKKELFFIPIFGLYLKKCNMIAINRNEGPKAMRKILNKVKEKINNGHSIIIFPEGTRKKPGELPSYKTGIAGIYKEAEISVLPVVVNSGLYWPKHTFIKKSGKIIIKFLEPISPNLEKNNFLKIIESTIEKETNKII
tara:strand:- start:30 stop:674 length:645 start_codon:yes stop_codon:yes gene_type:complete